MIKSFLLIISILSLGLSTSFGAQYNFGHIDYSDGLSNNRVLCFAEDINGFIWIGTSSGLNRYDGYSFKVFTHQDTDSSSLPDNLVIRMTKDQHGRLWIYTSTGMTIFNPNNEQFSNEEQFSVNGLHFNVSAIQNAIPMGDSIMLLNIPFYGIIEHNVFTNKNTTFQINNNNTLRTDFKISNIFYQSGTIYTLLNDGTILIVDERTREITQNIPPIKSFFIDENHTYELFIDDNKRIWLFNNDEANGVLFIDPNGNFKHYTTQSEPKLNSNIVSSIIQDSENTIWIGTDHGGINILNLSNQKVEYVEYDESNKNSLNQNVITKLYKGANGIIWIGTFKQGANFYHKNLFRFQHFKNNPNNPNSLIYNDVNCFTEDKKGNLWIGTNGYGLIYYNRKTKTFKSFKANSDGNIGLKSNVIVSLFLDKNQNLWIGTYHGGLSVYDGKIFKNYNHNPIDNRSISDNRIWETFEDSHGNFWIGSLGGGLDLFDRKTETFQNLNGKGNKKINSAFIMDIAEDHLGNVYFGTDYGVFVWNNTNENFTHFSHSGDKKRKLSDNFVRKLLIDSNNNLWIGTRDGLNLYNSRTDKMLIFNTKNGLPNNAIMGMLESESGDIWLSTYNGLCKIIVNYNDDGSYNDHFATNFNESDGLQGREYNEGSCFKTKNGELIFGGSNGFNIINTSMENSEKLLHKTHIIGLDIFGKEIPVNASKENNKSIKSSILNNKTIKLSYKENIFSLKFVAVDFLNSKKINYRYKLDGFNDQWINTSWNDRKATFTNLHPGKYTFKVQCSETNNDWEKSESSINIIILPPWYKTWVAYLIYGLIIFVIILLLQRVIILKEREKFKQAEIEKESKRQQELNQLKTKFFTNVSHEFRTPLTLILTPLEKLIKNSSDDEMYKHLSLMELNAKRLLNLVNQLLDFRKIEENKLEVNYIYGNIIGFIGHLVDSFFDYKESKDITLDFLPDEKELFMQFDKDKIEKILFNLLSNAFKFTPQKGFIRVFTETITINNQEQLIITVKDNGIGIIDDQKQKIFERFYQSNLPNGFIVKGSGIGLSMTRDFVEMLNGNITVESEVDKGSKFIITLPINRESTTTIDESTYLETKTKPIKLDSEESPIKENKNKKTVLLVEDNHDFRFYLKDSLQDKFNILEAENGKLALEILANRQPELIVSDVMMPEMDGLELCNEIKSNAAFSHIPIILLTAKSTTQNKLEGLKQGADEYITKPFNLDILKSRITYLLAQREKFIHHYQKSFSIESENNSITPLDEKLLKRANDLINENLSNSEFSVERLSKELGMSRVYLYKKLSSLTGKTPVELIRLVRLKKSAELLVNSQLTISEVAYEVGFSDPRYFSKQFKAEFKMLPSKFKENQGIV